MAGRAVVGCRFVSKKINKIRWKPQKYSRSGIPADTFVCGSYDHEDNELSLWKQPEDTDKLKDAVLVSTLTHKGGDVTDLQFLNENCFLAASSSGNVGLYEIENEKIVEKFTWDRIHYLNDIVLRSSCNALDTMEGDLITVGSDGKLNVLSALDTKGKPIRVIEADSSPITCVCFLKHNEALTGSLRGQLKMWDLRRDGDKPTATMYLTKVDTHPGPRGYPETHHPAATCVANHPTQSHVLVNGGEDGNITVWDLRDTAHPVCVLESHLAPVNEIQFHKEEPNHLFSCSGNGQLWHWDCSFPSTSTPLDMGLYPRDQCAWLALGMVKHRPAVSSVMVDLHFPINSLDVAGEKLICGADNEAIYMCNNIKQ